MRGPVPSAAVLGVLLLGVLAGCMERGGAPGAPSPEDPPGDSRQDSGDGPQGPSPTNKPGQAAGAPPQPTPNLGPTTWFLHMDLGCNEEHSFCNCGTVTASMDGDDRDSQCTAHGQRFPGVVQLPQQQCKSGVWCFPAAAPLPAYPGGTRVSGTVFLTTDAADIVEVEVQVYDGAVERGVGSTGPVTVVGAGGAQWTKAPFEFTLAKALDGGEVEVRLKGKANESYFIGYSGQERSFVEFTPA